MKCGNTLDMGKFETQLLPAMLNIHTQALTGKEIVCNLVLIKLFEIRMCAIRRKFHEIMQQTPAESQNVGII